MDGKPQILRRWVNLLMICVGIFAFIWTIARRTETVVPPVATAQVVGAHTLIFNGRYRVMGILEPGQIVNVLQLPYSSGENVPFQIVNNGKVVSSGYVSSIDLGHWQTSNPDLDLKLTFMSNELLSPTEGQIDSEIQWLTAWIHRYPTHPSCSKAHFEIARLNMIVVRKLRREGQLPYTWSDRLQNAKSNLRDVKDPKLQTAVRKLQKETDEASSQLESETYNSLPR